MRPLDFKQLWETLAKRRIPEEITQETCNLICEEFFFLAFKFTSAKRTTANVQCLNKLKGVFMHGEARVPQEHKTSA